MHRHENEKAHMAGSHICEICGSVLTDEKSLKEHYDKKHKKKYVCFYCGRSYKAEISLELHIKKHEMYHKDVSYE